MVNKIVKQLSYDFRCDNTKSIEYAIIFISGYQFRIIVPNTWKMIYDQYEMAYNATAIHNNVIECRILENTYNIFHRFLDLKCHLQDIIFFLTSLYCTESNNLKYTIPELMSKFA
uniref:Uncharacterized protein n=1 Tax=Micrurus lemniscatus lemniscatus TaxID=129467 RepID=A0A2D4JGW8_MICLE